VLLMIIVFGQLLMIWFSPTIQNNIPAKDKLNKIVAIPYENSKWFLKKYLGVTQHTVFLDEHFKGFNHIFKVVYVGGQKEEIIPIVNDSGMSSGYNSGSIWCNVSFKVITTNIEKDKIQKGIIPYLKYYINENKLKHSEFEFYVKEIETPNEWQKDFLKKQITKPWIKVGNCTIAKDSTTFYWNDRMQEILKNEANEN